MSPRQADAALFQVFPAALVVRHDATDGLPVAAAVAAVPQIKEFVHDNVVDQAHRGLDGAPVQTDRSAPVTASSPLLLVRDDDAGHRDASPRPPGLHPLRQPFCRMTPEPRNPGASNIVRLPQFFRRRHVQPAAAPLGVSASV